MGSATRIAVVNIRFPGKDGHVSRGPTWLRSYRDRVAWRISGLTGHHFRTGRGLWENAMRPLGFIAPALIYSSEGLRPRGGGLPGEGADRPGSLGSPPSGVAARLDRRRRVRPVG